MELSSRWFSSIHAFIFPAFPIGFCIYCHLFLLVCFQLLCVLYLRLNFIEFVDIHCIYCSADLYFFIVAWQANAVSSNLISIFRRSFNFALSALFQTSKEGRSFLLKRISVNFAKFLCLFPILHFRIWCMSAIGSLLARIAFPLL